MNEQPAATRFRKRPVEVLLDCPVLCVSCRGRDAELTVDPGESWARPICFDCLEDELEQDEARAIHPEAAAAILAARKDVRYRPLLAPWVDPATLDQTKLNALKRSWAAFSQRVSDLQRCWAILPSEGRCGRLAGSEGVCDTHAHVGCRLPGLGWRGDQPIGRIIVRQGRKVGHEQTV